MLDTFVSWWLARMAELFHRFLADAPGRAPDGIVIEAGSTDAVTASLRRKGREESLTLGVAARMASRRPVFLRPPQSVVLEKVHVVPAASRRDLGQLLRYELGRITPFPVEALFWHWQARTSPADRSRTEVTLTMVPKLAVTAVLDKLAAAGIQPRFLEVGAAGHPRFLPIADTGEGRPARQYLIRGLAWSCAGLAALVLILPFLLQAIALYATNSAIEALRPSVAQVEALRQGIASDGAGRTVLAQEVQRSGDVLQVLATVTRILPDDTYLTDFSLRSRHLTIGGRSASAPRLITALSADPAIRGAAFAAPVTRVEGATVDVFSIQGDIAP